MISQTINSLTSALSQTHGRSPVLVFPGGPTVAHDYALSALIMHHERTGEGMPSQQIPNAGSLDIAIELKSRMSHDKDAVGTDASLDRKVCNALCSPLRITIHYQTDVPFVWLFMFFVVICCQFCPIGDEDR